VVDRSGRLPAALLPARRPPADPKAPLPAPVAAAVRVAVGVDVAGRAAEWASDAVTVNLPRPGGDGFVSINPADGAITAETDRGLLSLANDLHKGRNAGGRWVWFIDIFAACVVFTSPGCCCCKSTPSGARSPGPSWGGRAGAAGADPFPRSLKGCLPMNRTPLALFGFAGRPARRRAGRHRLGGYSAPPVAEYHRPYVAIWLEAEGGAAHAGGLV
jgi:hypothetical protein